MKRALVTGGAKGIGAAVARALARDGWEVYLQYHRSRAQAEALAAETGGVAIQADLTDAAQTQTLFEMTGELDALVNNAGTAHYALLTDTSDDEWQSLFAVNAQGVFRCCRAAIPAMVRRKSGSIVNISSVWGVHGASCEAAYSASKGAVVALTRALAKELGPSGVRVNCVAPGVIETDMLSCLTETEKAALAEETPLGRLGEPEDVAELVAFLVSEKASFITGQIIAADGGLCV